MRFAHIADCHLGSWKLPELQQLNLKAFEKAISLCISEKVDFVLIAGDLFDSALPSIDVLKAAVSELKQLKEHNIPCYLVAGSHDYSASGKTMLDVLEKAGLCENVATEQNTNEPELKLLEKKDFVIAGISGKKAELEKELIKKIKIPSLGKKFKILALHTTIEGSHEFLAGLDSAELPAGFDYYALGHIHKQSKQELNKKLLVYPGPLFPNNFAELEELGNGGFFIVDVDKDVSIERQEIKLKEIEMLNINAEGKSPDIVTSEVLSRLKKTALNDKIALLRISGKLLRGRTSEIDFKAISEAAEAANCAVLLKNISALESPELQAVETKAENIEQIETELIAKQKPNQFNKFIPLLLKGLELEKQEGETTSAFEARLFGEAEKLLEIAL